MSQVSTRHNHGITCRMGRDIRPAGRFGYKPAKHPIRLHVGIISGEHQEIIERQTASLPRNGADSLRCALSAGGIPDIGEILDSGFLEGFGEAYHRVRFENAAPGRSSLLIAAEKRLGEGDAVVTVRHSNEICDRVRGLSNGAVFWPVWPLRNAPGFDCVLDAPVADTDRKDSVDSAQRQRMVGILWPERRRFETWYFRSYRCNGRFRNLVHRYFRSSDVRAPSTAPSPCCQSAPISARALSIIRTKCVLRKVAGGRVSQILRRSTFRRWATNFLAREGFGGGEAKSTPIRGAVSAPIDIAARYERRRRRPVLQS
jgi:hypothetical protein